MHPFDQASAVIADAGGMRAHLDPAWFGSGGPHGGVLAAIALRAMTELVRERALPPQMLSLRFLRAPREGTLELDAALERAGRRTASAVATLRQGDRVCVRAAATFVAEIDAGVRFAPAAPELPAPEATPAAPVRDDWPPFLQRMAQRIAIGEPPFSGAAQRLTGGWLQTDPPHPVDAPLLAMLSDAWFPSLYPRLRAPVGVPTLDLTVHFLAALPEPLPAEPLRVRFALVAASHGRFVEDGTIWSAAGLPLASCRQSALILDGEGWAATG